MSRLQGLLERFWFVPALLCVSAALLAEGLVRLDRASPGSTGWLDAVFYQVGESGSRTVLAAIATSSLAVAGTTFSITMAVLALTSSSYGPRLVRNFMADRGNQAVLGVFTATFLYSLLVLRAIGAGEPETFVPQIAVNVAVGLAVLDVAVLVYFIHHISDSVQIATLSREVRDDLNRAVDLLYPEHLGHGPEVSAETDDDTAEGAAAQRLRRLCADGREVLAGRPGYLTAVAETALLEVTTEHDVVVALEVRPGRHLLQGMLLLRVHPSEVSEDVVDALSRSFTIGDLRTPYQDIEFAVQQLTELAVRALSPGTNDPYTAINALDDLTVGLSRLAARPDPSPVRRDRSGVPRVLAPRPDPATIVADLLDSMRWYASGAPSVMRATLRLVEEVGTAARSSELRARLRRELRLLREAVAGAGLQKDDVAALEAHADRVERAIMLG